MLGPLLTNWTIRLALICYAAVLAGEIAAPQSARRSWLARLVWTVGCVLFLCHVDCAFQFYHHLSLAEAYANSAQRTGEMIGFPFGAGIFFSYAFGLLWAGDVLWWWTAPQSYAARSWWLSNLLHLYLFFIAFNGAVVFEGGPTRWVAGVATLGLLLLLAMRILGRRGATSTTSACQSSASPEPTRPADA
jgi:hypothetical protein